MRRISRIFRKGKKRQNMPYNVTRWSWMIAIIAICALTLMPVITIAVMSMYPEQDTWTHIMTHVLPGAAYTSLVLMISVALCTLIIGTITAWLITMHRFPGHRIFEWLLPAPLAAPSYITAYCYAELLDYAGPLQHGMRRIFGWQNANDYWFPEICSLGGAIFVMSMALYPYVYMTARMAFLTQSTHLFNVGRTLGHTVHSTFRMVALPLARPALIAGVTLASLETINDIGTVEFFGVQTLTVSIYSTWLGRGLLTGAAQLSLILLIFVFTLICIEHTSRQKKRFFHPDGHLPIHVENLTGATKWIAMIICAMPIMLGLIIPVIILARFALSRLDITSIATCMEYVHNSVMISALAAILTVCVALMIAYAKHVIQVRWFTNICRMANLGYAIPGTILAIGIMMPLAMFDNTLNDWAIKLFSVSTGMLLNGSIFALTLAYIIRFLAIANGPIEVGMGSLKPHMSLAAQTLGCAIGSTFLRIQLPLIRLAIIPAALLVFVDTMKELPATLLLRSFDFETLATHVYSYASMERFEDASISALIIVLVGMTPIIMLNHCQINRLRTKRSSDRTNGKLRTQLR